MSKPILRVVIASTRPGRAGGPVGNWFTEFAAAHSKFQVEASDLRELNFPAFSEPNLPFTGKYELPQTIEWASLIKNSAAVVFVTPEYNYSFPASLKNAIDMLGPEWRGKPVGFVGYGALAGGSRAVQQLLPVAFILGMKTVGAPVFIPFVGRQITDGKFNASDEVALGATGLLDALADAVN